MNRTIAALFDLDGVIVDTESQYSIYWNNVGVKYLSDPDRRGNRSGKGYGTNDTGNAG